MSQRLFPCYLALFLVGLSGSSLQGQTLDQVCDPVPTHYAYILSTARQLSTSAGNELYQNFVPSATPLVRVEVKAAAGAMANFRVRILDPYLDFNENELGSTMTNEVSSGWVVASFADSPIDLVAGATYTIALSWTGGGTSLWWAGADLDPYPMAGPEPSDQIPDDKLLDVDWAFRTYSGGASPLRGGEGRSPLGLRSR